MNRPLLFSLILTLFIGASANAGLGDQANSVTTDRKFLSATKKASRALENYTVQEMESGGTTVREYISPSGIVFAVSWEGLTHPDLTPLLSSYHAEYKQERKKQHKKSGRRNHSLKTHNVVVEKSGHMRHLRGRAYAPSLLPQGVSLDEIK